MATKTASAAYEDGRDRINAATKTLQAALRAHAQRQRQTANRSDWGFPGDLGRVLSLVEEATSGLK